MSSALGFDPQGRPQPAAVESPITTAWTPGSAPPIGAGSASGSTPTRSSSVLTLRSTLGVLAAVSAIPPTLTRQTTAMPATSIFHSAGRLRTAATATSGITANPTAISVSQTKYRSQPAASCWLSVSSTLAGPWARSICTTCESMVMCSKRQLGPDHAR